MLDLSNQPALWDTVPEVTILPDRESSSTLDYAWSKAGLGPESSSLIPNQQMRELLCYHPPLESECFAV